MLELVVSNSMAKICSAICQAFRVFITVSVSVFLGESSVLAMHRILFFQYQDHCESVYLDNVIC